MAQGIGGNAGMPQPAAHRDARQRRAEIEAEA